MERESEKRREREKRKKEREKRKREGEKSKENREIDQEIKTERERGNQHSSQQTFPLQQPYGDC